MLALRLAFALTIVAPVVRAASTDWPEFRGPTGQGVSTATNVPLHWSNTDNIAWRTQLPGTSEGTASARTATTSSSAIDLPASRISACEGRSRIASSCDARNGSSDKPSMMRSRNSPSRAPAAMPVGTRSRTSTTAGKSRISST